MGGGEHDEGAGIQCPDTGGQFDAVYGGTQLDIQKIGGGLRGQGKRAQQFLRPAGSADDLHVQILDEDIFFDDGFKLGELKGIVLTKINGNHLGFS